MTPSFGDLRLITSTVDCIDRVPDWSLNSASCDPWDRPFNLPSIWVKIFSFLHITESKTAMVGYFLIFLFCISAYYWILLFLNVSTSKGISRYVYLGIIFLFFVSPPVLLLLERGNVDILIFAGVTLAIKLIKRSRFASIQLIAFLGALKIFPWAAIPALVRMKLSRFSSLVLAMSLLVLSFGLAREVSIIRERSTTDFNVISFGVSIVPKYFLSKFNVIDVPHFAHIMGFVAFIALFLTIRFQANNSFSTACLRVVNYFKLDIDLGDVFVISTLVFLGSYLVGTSYDYRLVFVIPLLIMLLTAPMSPVNLRILSGIGMIVLYNSYWFSPLVGIVSDLTLMAFAPWLAYLLYELMKTNFRFRSYRH